MTCQPPPLRARMGTRKDRMVALTSAEGWLAEWARGREGDVCR